MENIFVEFLPPWVETGLQPAFYDKESGTVLQQTARMYARVNMLIRMFNRLSKQTKEEVERFEGVVDTRVTNFENSVNETVDDYIEQFNQLHDYVYDYFDNLDVQEEINNKLDDMVEQGTLQNIIYDYINAKAIFGYDNVASMKSTTNLVDGSYAETLGYYSKNDGGGGLYKIRTKLGTDNPDEMLMIAIGDDLVAELVVDTTINSKQCGLKGDGTTDETAKLNTFFALSNSYDKVLNNGLYITSGTVFIKGRWADQQPSTQKILFDRATIKYTGTAGNASIIIFDMKHAEIDGLNIATNSNDNYVQLTGCWFTKINNWVVRSLKLSNDTSQISTFGYSTPSCEYVYFVNCRLWHGNLSIDTTDSYINSIFFNNTAIEAYDKTHCVIFNGARSHQNINFKGCDLSYASTAVFLINDTLIGNGYVSCDSCYFDSYIPLYTASNGLTLNVTNSIAASYQETLPILYSDRISMYLNNPFFVDGNNDNSDGVNYVINGDMSSSNEYPAVASNRIMGVTNNNQSKSYISSNFNANNRARVCDFTHATASNQTLYVDYKGVPRAGHYTVYLRLKITEGSCNGVQISISSEYPTWTFNKIGLNNEVLLVHYIKDHTLPADTDSSFSVIFTNASTDLKVEFYEIGLIYGKKYVPNAKLFAGSAI